MAFSAYFILSSASGIGLVFFTCVYFYFKYYIYNYWRKRNVVFEEPMVPFGNVRSVAMGKMHIGECYVGLYEKYKRYPYFGSYAFFKPILVINDTNLIREVLTKNFHNFQDRNLFCNEKIDPMTGQLFVLPGEKWRYLRSKLTPTFTSGKIKLMFHTIKNTGEELSKCFRECHGSDVEITEIFARYTTDVIMETAFGVKADCLQNPKSVFRFWGKKIFEQGPIVSLLSVFAPKVMYLFGIPFFERKLSQFFIGVFEETFKARQKQRSEKPRDFLDLLMQLIDHDIVEGGQGNVPKLVGTIELRSYKAKFV